MIEKPMNPYAEEDFKSAIRNATERLNKQVEELHNKFESIGFINLEPMDEPYCGKMRLNYLNGLGAWQDVANILVAHGYEVTLHTEVASEVEREVDGIDKWIVIEFNEVE